MYVSSDACDEFGPERDLYSTHLGIYPDAGFWEIIEHADCPDELSNVPDGRIKEVLAILEFDEDIFQEAKRLGNATDADREEIIADIQRDAPALTDRALLLSWQFQTGEFRSEYVEDEIMVEALQDLEFFSENEPSMLVMQSEGWHRAICVNPTNVSFVAFPKHRLERAALTELGRELDKE